MNEFLFLQYMLIKSIGGKKSVVSIDSELIVRSGSRCELCGATDRLSVFAVRPKELSNINKHAYLCAQCIDRIIHPQKTDVDYWCCLSHSVWSRVPAIQALVWRILTFLVEDGEGGEAWPQEFLAMMHLEDEVLLWAQAFDGEFESAPDRKLSD